ncbi:MAG: hypothetical protein ACKVH8_19760 [Pirellulales bacterium]|jgi:hypothetical protein
MSYSIVSKLEHDYLYIESTGSIRSVEEWKEYVNQLWDEMQRYDVTKLLLNEREIVIPKGDFAQFQIAETILEFSNRVRDWQVVIVQQDDHREDNESFLTYMYNRGFRYYFFYNLDEARQFMMKE